MRIVISNTSYLLCFEHNQYIIFLSYFFDFIVLYILKGPNTVQKLKIRYN